MIDRISASSSPRLQMSLVLSGAALGGWIASMVLHRAGVTQMVLRYPLSTAISYAVFFFCLSLWVRFVTSQADAASFIENNIESGIRNATNSLEDSVNISGKVFSHSAESSDGLKDFSPGDLVPGDIDEGAALLLLAAILLILCSAAIYLIYIAPTFIADILMGGMLSAGLYRKMEHLELHQWVGHALRHTWWVFLAIALLTGLCGFGIQHFFPAAHTLVDLVRLIAE